MVRSTHLQFAKEVRLLRSLWGNEKSAFNPGARPVQHLGGLTVDTEPGERPERKPRSASRVHGTRRSPVKVGRLYPERKSEAELHAREILRHIQVECEDLAGCYVPKADLERAYRELCELEGWPAKHWCAVGRELARITGKRLLQRQGKRFRAYRIPKPERATRKLV
jgi:hypothetical protein